MLEEGEASFNKQYRNFLSELKRNKRTTTVTKEEFKELISSKCEYCGAEPNIEWKGNNQNGTFKRNRLKKYGTNITKYTIIVLCSECIKDKEIVYIIKERKLLSEYEKL